jgi:hypothetical protein
VGRALKVLAGGSFAVRSVSDGGLLSSAMAKPGAANANATTSTIYLNMIPTPQKHPPTPFGTVY